MTAQHGEYKVPGGKLVVVDFELTAGAISNFRLSGDFFLEPDDALEHMNAAVNGLSGESPVAEVAAAVQAALPAGTQMLGVTPEAIGVAVRRALTGAAQWRDYDWEIVRTPPISPLLNAALDEVLTTEVGRGERGPTLRIWEWDRPAVFIGSFQSVRNEVDEPQLAAREAQLRALQAEGVGGAQAARILRPLDVQIARYRFAPIRIIEPEEEYSETLEFDPAKIRAAIDAGRRAVEHEWDALEPLLS